MVLGYYLAALGQDDSKYAAEAHRAFVELRENTEDASD